MNDFWKSSKSTALILALTGFVGICVLAFAYHLRHFTEILSGVIGGLTIILGMVTAEWLRSAREDSEANASRLHALWLNFFTLTLNFELNVEDSLSPRFQRQMKTYWDVQYQLHLLAVKTRWPQQNAKRIRRKSLLLEAKLLAMMRDALENDHLWSAEKRHKLQEEMVELGSLILPGGKEVDASFTEMYLKSRETQVREGMSKVWLKQVEREKER